MLFIYILYKNINNLKYNIKNNSEKIMGCGDPQEKLENKIMEMNIDKIEIQMERYKQTKLLEDMNIINAKEKPNNNADKVDNNNEIRNNHVNSKRKTMITKTSKTGKGRKSKSVKSLRIQKNINIE